MEVWYAEAEMPGIGLEVFVIVLVLANVARRFNVGPQWLREFKIEKHTFY